MPTNVRGNEFLRKKDLGEVKEIRSPDGEIKNLYCPDCDSQAYKTDHPGIAVCGACPGWYFKYSQQVENNKPKFILKIVNGEHVKVPVYDTERLEYHP